MVAQGIHQVAAIQAQQRGDDQRATDQQADLADRQLEVVGQVHHQVGQGKGTGDGEGEGGAEQQAYSVRVAFYGGEHTHPCCSVLPW
ncbi:hypothetical protein D3C73_1579280 [compost metagenome]